MSKRIMLLSYLMKTGEFSRAAEAVRAVQQRRVLVNGIVAEDPKTGIRRTSNILLVKDGVQHALQLQRPLYLAMDKPPGYVCQKTSTGERTIYGLLDLFDLDPKTRASLFCIGRLDRDTEGLLLVTNDGQLEKLVTRPAHQVMKTYEAIVEKPVSPADLAHLLAGVTIRDDDTGRSFPVRAVRAQLLGPRQLELVITEGKKRQVKKMVAALDNRVLSLKRTAIGGLRLADIDFHGSRIARIGQRELRRIASKGTGAAQPF
ncbi:MAG: rRNA pseudouridine synthase [Candidatus Aenigmarchaeota archaeon]|nr:rRNA pseudouridine synthase [Candidatus Aenigmarchaeota archaeon]